MADDDQELQLAAKLPFSERVAHKNWKVRAEAYADIKAVCERAAGEDDPALADFGAPPHMCAPPAAPQGTTLRGVRGARRAAAAEGGRRRERGSLGQGARRRAEVPGLRRGGRRRAVGPGEPLGSPHHRPALLEENRDPTEERVSNVAGWRRPSVRRWPRAA